MKRCLLSSLTAELNPYPNGKLKFTLMYGIKNLSIFNVTCAFVSAGIVSTGNTCLHCETASRVCRRWYASAKWVAVC